MNKRLPVCDKRDFSAIPHQSICLVLPNSRRIVLLLATFITLITLSDSGMSLQRILMNDKGGVIQLKRGQSAATAIRKYELRSPQGADAGCQPTATVGFPVLQFPSEQSSMPTTKMLSRHGSLLRRPEQSTASSGNPGHQSEPSIPP